MNLKATAGLAAPSSLLFGCLSGKQVNAPVGVNCLPQSPVSKDCRNLPIVCHPFTPESASLQLTVRSDDPALEPIIGLTPTLVHPAKGFDFTESPVFQVDAMASGGLLFFATSFIAASILSNGTDWMSRVLPLPLLGRSPVSISIPLVGWMVRQLICREKCSGKRRRVSGFQWPEPSSWLQGCFPSGGYPCRSLQGCSAQHPWLVPIRTMS